MKKYILLFLNLSALGGLLLNLISCNTTEPPIIPPPPPDLRKITLTFEDASCTEVWLKIKADSLTLPAEIKLISDAVTLNIILTIKDTVLYIDSLLPNQAYNYQAVLSTDTTIKSEKVTAQTLEPTSHNFTWQSWEFGGECGSSILYDVAIINENNIWAVGEIYLKDSLGNCDPKAYNAVHWNGNEWELRRIPILLSGYPFYPVIRSLFAFNQNDIWFEAGIHWDGVSFKQITINISFPSNVNKIWGEDGTSIYFVGNNGNIAHATATQFGYNFTKIESGTTLDIFDIWGSVNSEYNKILCSAGSFSQVQEKILRINQNQSVDTIPWLSGIRINSVWFPGRYKTFACGDGIWIGDENYNWVRQQFGSQSFVNKIRGNANNDVFAVGAFGMATHFNGVSWQVLPPISLGASFFSVSTKNNVVTIVGTKNSKAFIAVGLK